MSLADDINFGQDGLLPVAVTDHASDRLLVLCFLNREALEKSMEEGIVHVFRRSKGVVVAKGVSSGHVQRVREIRVNCDRNSLEIRVDQQVAACAHGYYSCYYRRWHAEHESWEVIDERVFDPDEVYR
ncbi:MAG: phosphoribosyl-AMP cyclohydrolase [Candidatus Latescibacteria bacterium]|jgi:phosphoribosyl-AMP cyclohydrolase|nr:phosphoribosyl-AMP cyclohydrolase [Candidatus Latescibacterota bacterium]MDP7450111.1 phosphoribosyl-AMP cyclohydrolase [Candidatus Latescibacterota bacterium]HJP30737.1 phosphoribosyl-AMP cyclohydrolase [Candidatus Latescibacterota bacterium]|tara:strand:- start:84 stop:467 length:384 start_codon:yes stop_codon:yes gene_type:complete